MKIGLVCLLVMMAQQTIGAQSSEAKPADTPPAEKPARPKLIIRPQSGDGGARQQPPTPAQVPQQSDGGRSVPELYLPSVTVINDPATASGSEPLKLPPCQEYRYADFMFDGKSAIPEYTHLRRCEIADSARQYTEWSLIELSYGKDAPPKSLFTVRLLRLSSEPLTMQRPGNQSFAAFLLGNPVPIRPFSPTDALAIQKISLKWEGKAKEPLVVTAEDLKDPTKQRAWVVGVAFVHGLYGTSRIAETAAAMGEVVVLWKQLAEQEALADFTARKETVAKRWEQEFGRVLAVVQSVPPEKLGVVFKEWAGLALPPQLQDTTLLSYLTRTAVGYFPQMLSTGGIGKLRSRPMLYASNRAPGTKQELLAVIENLRDVGLDKLDRTTLDERRGGVRDWAVKSFESSLEYISSSIAQIEAKLAELKIEQIGKSEPTGVK